MVFSGQTLGGSFSCICEDIKTVNAFGNSEGCGDCVSAV